MHELLSSPTQNPDEGSMVRIVATLGSALSELCEILDSGGQYPAASTAAFDRTSNDPDTIASIARLAREFCSECIPSRHAQALQPWTRAIERAAHRIA